MKAIDLCVFLTSYTLVVAVAATGELLRTRVASSVITVAVALIALSATTVVGFYLEPGANYLGTLWFLAEQKDFSALAALGFGAAAGLIWVTRLTDRYRLAPNGPCNPSMQRYVTQFVSAASILGVVICCQAFVWKSILGVQRDPAVRIHAPGFVIDKVADLDFLPVRIAASENGRVYVCYDYFEKWGTMGGAIVELCRDGTSGSFQQKVVADSTFLMRCYGLVTRHDELFVSRTGVNAQATNGKVSYTMAGAVTQLRDVDGDGYFEFAHDIVTGLPGARGPDTMQQNNGISFAADGSLFVTTASSANRALDDHPWAGAVLRVSPDFSQTEIFAKGFRNPFGIVIGPDDELFVTDNDIDENPGDELNHVVQGSHYGHPYVVPNEPSVNASGFRDPILVGELESNYLGMAFATSPSLPDEYRNCIYLADYMQDAILRLTLAREKDTYKVTAVDKFATISTPVDIAVTPSGEFFVISRRTQNVYRIRPRNPVSKGSDG